MAETKPRMGQEVARKVTIGTVAGDASKWFEKLMAVPLNEQGERKLSLCRIYGFANAGKPGKSEFSEFIKFQGQFEGVNLMTGEVTKSGNCILPNFYGDALFAALNVPDRVGSIKFAIDVDVKYDPTSVTKYMYVLLDKVAPAADDPMKALAAEAAGMPLLAAPASSEAPAASPAPTAAPAIAGGGKKK